MSTSGGYHDACGDTISTSGMFSTSVGYHEYIGGYYEYIGTLEGYHEYIRGCLVNGRCSEHQYTNVHVVSPQCTEHPRCTEHTLYRVITERFSSRKFCGEKHACQTSVFNQSANVKVLKQKSSREIQNICFSRKTIAGLIWHDFGVNRVIFN